MAALVFGVSAAYSQTTWMGDKADAWVSGTAAGHGPADTGASVAFGAATPDVFVGRSAAGVVGEVVYVFKLPTLAASQSIASATFSFTNLTSSSTLTANIDLYGLTYRETPTVTTGDYYVGSSDTANATLIKSHWFVSGSAATFNTNYTTDAEASSRLTTYLNAQYTAGAKGGNYIFLRLNSDAFSDQGRLDVATADHPMQSYRPCIVYTIAP